MLYFKKKIVYSDWNFVTIVYTSEKITVFMQDDSLCIPNIRCFNKSVIKKSSNRNDKIAPIALIVRNTATLGNNFIGSIGI